MTPAGAQRDRALTNAQSIRLRRAAVKRAIAAGELDATDVVLAPPEQLLSMRTFEFLECCPNIGEEKLRRLNPRAVHDGVNLFRSLEQLTARQRGWLAEQIARLQTAQHTSHTQ